MKKLFFIAIACIGISGCSCKEWGYCAHIFPNAERLAENDSCNANS